MKKRLGKALALFVAFAVLFTLALPANAAEVSTSAVAISKTKQTMYVARTATLKITGTTKTVTWSSSDKSVAKVAKSGTYSAKVTAVKAGTAVISAKVGSKTYKCTVTVKKNNWTYSGNPKTAKDYEKLPKVNKSQKKCTVKFRLTNLYFNAKGQLIAKGYLYNTKDSTAAYTFKSADVEVTDKSGLIAEAHLHLKLRRSMRIR